MPSEPTENLESVLEKLATASTGENVRINDVVTTLGSRSFGPLLLAPSAIIVTPASVIPGLPTVLSVFIGLVSVQMLFHRKYVWLPPFLSRQQMPRRHLTKAIDWLQPAARLIDRLVRPRLSFLVEGSSNFLVALICMMLAIMMPLLELIPMSNSIAGGAIFLFGLAITVQDGALAALGVLLVGLLIYLAVGLFM